ncbi:MmgE/PrpD family protein [Sphingomonas sp. ZT3P38]|uniref:MmgE/PrpD family protein n=1 Tax=Parasphingomonas zepuensis TaxID=3096161 RepID=UPI002FCB2895
MDQTSRLSERIAGHIVGCEAERLPATTIHAAKRALLDGLGVMLAASGTSPEIEAFVTYAQAGGAGRASILGRGTTATASLAALANGAMAHALDFEDAFDAAPSHPNASLLPAVLAVLQDGPPVSGRDLLAAIAVGCDLVCRLGLSLRREMEAGGWYPPPILGVFGATAAVARLRGLSQRETLDALSLALCQASCPGEIKYSRDTVIRAVREALPAESAVRATALAALGVRGFDEPFEGKGGFFRLYADGRYDPAALLDGLGERFWIEQLSFKRWPACRGTHAYIEAVQALRAAHGFSPDDVAEIVATGGEVQVMLVEPPASKRAPATAIDAKFSIPFTVAAALIDGEVTLDSYDGASLADPRKLAQAAKVRFERHPDWGRERAASGGLRIVLRDGTRLEQWVDVAAGHVSRPIDDAGLQAKFIDCAGRAQQPLSGEGAAALATAIWSLDEAPDAALALSAICYTT